MKLFKVFAALLYLMLYAEKLTAQAFVPPSQAATFQKFKLGVNISLYENY